MAASSNNGGGVSHAYTDHGLATAFTQGGTLYGGAAYGPEELREGWMHVGDGEVLRDVFRLVGGGCHLQLASVSARFRQQHNLVFSKRRQSFKSTVASVALARWALDNMDVNELGTYKRRVCDMAAGGGHLQVLQWARANGCTWNKDVCSKAALGGHLQVLQWARANGCPWDSHVCSNAAYGGHLEILQWARANGCPEGQARAH